MTPARVAKMRAVRRMLRSGIGVREIATAVRVTECEIALQRRLMALAGDDTSDMLNLKRSMAGSRAWVGRSKASAAEHGDLLDIISAQPSRRDFRFAYRGDG